MPKPARSSSNTEPSSQLSSAVADKLQVDKLRLYTQLETQNSLWQPGRGGSWTVRGRSQQQIVLPLVSTTGAPVRVEIRDYRATTQEWLIEFNPSNFVHVPGGRGVRVGDMSRVLSTLEKFFEKEGAIKRANGFLQRAKVTRLDLCIDFDVGAALCSPILRALYSLRRDGRTKPHLYRGLNEGETLQLEPGRKKPNGRFSWIFRLYDAFALAPERAGLRAELQLRTKPLRRAGVKVVGDLLQFDAAAEYVKYWQRCRLGAEIVAGSELAGRLQQQGKDAGWKANLVGATLGYIYLRDHAAVLASQYSEHHRKKFEHLLQAARCEAIDWEDRVEGRLDLLTQSFVRE